MAINAGSIAIAGVIILGSPNCSINANIAYGVHAITKAVKFKMHKYSIMYFNYTFQCLPAIITAIIRVTRFSARLTRPDLNEF